jgi:phosphatidylserine/phosphatidylglycerophosphate/cardiolipin synthase-like enzyme
LGPDYQKKEWADPLMHHKCYVIDDLVITGSANATKAAQNDNIENINILRDLHAVEEHRQEFARLKAYCKKYKKK